MLCKANIITKIYKTAANGLPLGAEANLDRFKLIFVDIALSQQLLGLDIKEWSLSPIQQIINQGSITEAVVGQELLAYAHPARKRELYYWQREERGSHAEVDYLIQHNNQILPLEVKSQKGSSLRSLHLFLENHAHVQYGIRFSQHTYSYFDKIKSYPLYAIFGLFPEEIKLFG